MKIMVLAIFSHISVFHVYSIIFLVWHLGTPFYYLSLFFNWLFYGDWRHLRKDTRNKVIFLFWLCIRFLILSSIEPGNTLFHFNSSLHCKIVSFSPYSEWIKREFVATLKNLTATGRQFGGILAAHSIATTLKYWYHGSPPGEIVSLGILSEGKSGFFVSCKILKPMSMPCAPNSVSPPI